MQKCRIFSLLLDKLRKCLQNCSFFAYLAADHGDLAKITAEMQALGSMYKELKQKTADMQFFCWPRLKIQTGVQA
jgi:hypothetical protein